MARHIRNRDIKQRKLPRRIAPWETKIFTPEGNRAGVNREVVLTRILVSVNIKCGYLLHILCNVHITTGRNVRKTHMAVG